MDNTEDITDPRVLRKYDDAGDARLGAYSYVLTMGDKIVKLRENLIRCAMRSPADRRILAQAGHVITDEEIEYIKEKDSH